MTYSFDTSTFIEAWKRHYPRDLFPTIWEFLIQKAAEGIIFASALVKKELENQEDELYDFIRENLEFIFTIPTEDEHAICKELINHPDFNKWGKGKAHEADPFVVALAAAHGYCVVSYEALKKEKNSIPRACTIKNVEHKTFIEFLRTEGFRN
jgi:hypothetical protein